MNKQKVMILGAGPAGMACALELSNRGLNSLIIEKDDAVGGFAKTLTFKEGNLLFRTDIGPHRFFSKNKYLYDLIDGLLGTDWILVKRQTRQLIEGKFYDYPINAMQAFRNVGPFRAFDMGISYIFGAVRYKLFHKKISNFEDYIVANFGKKLGAFNMLNYTEKIWGIPCTQIHPDWAKQRIKGLSLVSALKDALLKKRGKDSPKTLVDSFYYPRQGTGMVYEAIGKKVKSKGGVIRTNSFPVSLVHDDDRITEVAVNISGKVVTLEPDNIVSSVPIGEMIKLLKPSPPLSVVNAVKNLKWRAQVYLFITLDKERVTSDDWIYFPDRSIPFGRAAEMKNFSKDMSPKNKTSLFVEFYVNEDDEIWNMSEKGLFELALQHFEKLKLFTKGEVRNYYVLKKKNVYPIYDLGYFENLKIVKEYLNKFKNFHYIGRPGRFHYTNQDHRLEMGILAARSILEGKNYDLDKVGAEEEYFESGFIKKNKSNS